MNQTPIAADVLLSMNVETQYGPVKEDFALSPYEKHRAEE